MFDFEYFDNVIYRGVSNRLKEDFIKNNFKDFYEFLIKEYVASTFLEKIYIYRFGQSRCYCGRLTKFISFSRGYLEFCSISCSSKSSKTRNKYKETCLFRYGIENISTLDDVKNKKKNSSIEKFGKATYLQTDDCKNIMLEKYGVDNPFKSKDTQKKIKNTNLLKYGVECVLTHPDIVNKKKETTLERYGVDHFSKTKKWKELVKKSNDEYYVESLDLPVNYQFISKSKNLNLIKHIDCGMEFEIQTQLIRLRKNKNVEICKKCNAINYHLENGLMEYIKGLYTGKIEKYRDRKYEIDIYLPELMMGFEFNGLYWHSELFKDNDYHLNKNIYFEKMGIRIINIWEDDWLYKNEVTKSVIKSIFGKYDKTIYSRKCLVKKVNDSDCKKFLNENHIQGWCVSKYRYALFVDDEIVSILTIGNNRLNLGNKNIKKDQFEILRFCNKLNTKVIGGFSKLLKKFSKEVNFTKIITYSDCSIFTGNVYIQNGFEFIERTQPGYSYIINGYRKNRFNFTKSKLLKMGYDKYKTEHQIMFDNSFFRIYDCGNLKFEFIYKQI
jgi:hypothetical protein